MILQRYVLRELVVSFLFGLAVLVALLLLGGAFQAFRSTEGLALEIVARLAPLMMVELAALAVLTSSATAATLVYGRLSAENEIDAMRMSGISPARVFMPALLFGLVLTGATHAIVEHASPRAYAERRKVVAETALLFLRSPPPGRQQLRIESFRLGYDDCKDRRMTGLWLMKFRPTGDPEIKYQAASGTAEIPQAGPPRLIMSRPEVIHYDPQGRTSTITVENDVGVDLATDNATPPRDRKLPEMSAQELWDHAQGLPAGHRKRAEALTLYHTRFAQSAAPLLLILVAVPTGVFVKKASRLAGLGAALPPLLVYFVGFFIFQGMGARGRVPPEAAAYAPDALLGALAIGLLWGVLRR